MTHPGKKVIEELVAGLEGVTPGPWEIYDGCSWRRIGTTGRGYNDCAVLAPTKASDGHPDLSCASGNDLYANLRHIARCHPDAILSIAEYVKALQEENERLRKALEPFAKDEPDNIDVLDDGELIFPKWSDLTAGDFRRARLALHSKSTEESK